MQFNFFIKSGKSVLAEFLSTFYGGVSKKLLCGFFLLQKNVFPAWFYDHTVVRLQYLETFFFNKEERRNCGTQQGNFFPQWTQNKKIYFIGAEGGLHHCFPPTKIQLI
jgi:hypothetical protein